MLYEDLYEFALAGAELNDGEINVIKRDSEILEFLFDNCEIAFPDGHRFFGTVNCEWIMHEVGIKRRSVCNKDKNMEKYKVGEETLTYVGDYDFGHTAAGWEDVLRLGIIGLRERVGEYENKNGDANGFYSATIKVYDALLRFMKRCADEAEKQGKTEIANGLNNLTKRAPNNLF